LNCEIFDLTFFKTCHDSKTSWKKASAEFSRICFPIRQMTLAP
jgi:hypothetical protein